jgi:hypothetical protein
LDNELSQKDLALQDAALALKRCVGVFRALSEAGRYPPMLLEENGGHGWMFAINAQKKCEEALEK